MQTFTPIVIDGLDGSGKATTLATISTILVNAGFDVLKTEYPNYQLPWGALIADILHDRVKAELELKEKMLLYALNRVESVPLIQASLKSIQTTDSKRPLVLLFDRYPTSNVLTTAYYFQLNPPQSDEDEIVELLAYMDQIDHFLYDTFNLRGVKVNIPLLESSSVIEALNGDHTRVALDNYEVENVQQQAARLYKILFNKYPERFYLFSQYKEDNSRMTPDEISMHILEKNLSPDLFQKIESSSKSVGTKAEKIGEVYELSNDNDLIDQSLINTLLEEFGTDKVAQLNPFKL